MNTSLQLFQYKTQNVRTVLVDGEPWFVTKDVCAVLGIRNVSDAVSRLDEDGVGTTEVIDSLGRRQQASAVNESSLYELIFQSRKSEAVGFRRWVTKEVLPTIRRTGSYAVPALTGAELMARAVLEAQEIIAEKDRMIQELAPRVKYYNKVFIGAENDYDCKDAAGLLLNQHGIQIGRNHLLQWLRDNGWISPIDDRPYQRYLAADLLRLKLSTWINQNTGELGDPQVRITPKGVERIRKALSIPVKPMALRSVAKPVAAVSKAKKRRRLPAA